VFLPSPGNRRDTLVGLSCLLYAAPVLLGAPVTYLAQAMASFGSDYIYTGLVSRVHLLDRWMATIHTLHAVALAAGIIPGQRGGSVLPLWLVACLTASAIACFGMSKRCIARGDFEAYRLWHTLWHIAGPAVMCVIFYRYCGIGGPPRSANWVPLACSHSPFA
jgi:hypothetical protein